MLAGQDLLSPGLQPRYAHPLIAPVTLGAVGFQLLGGHRSHPADDVGRGAAVGIGAPILLIPVNAGYRGQHVVVVHADLGGDVGDGHSPVGWDSGVPAAYLIRGEPCDQRQRRQESVLVFNLAGDDADGDDRALGRQA